MTTPMAPEEGAARAGRRVAGWLSGTATGLGRGVVGGLQWPEHRVRGVQRRTIGTLVATQAFGGVGVTIGVAVAAILAEQVSGSEKLAGLAQTTQVLGAALASALLAHLMGRRGRRPGLALGYLLGAGGAGLTVLAGVVSSFPLLLVGTTLIGATTAANSQSRYAATDLARPGHTAGALSLVVWATTVGAVAGPNLTGVAGRVALALGLPRLTGPFLFGAAGMLVAAGVLTVFLRPDPLLVARQAALAHRPAAGGSTSWSRALLAVRERPGVATGIAALALAHAVMVAVMVMTPLHMHHGGAGLEIIGIVVSVHVLGMYALAPVVGWAADRLGRPAVLAAGAAVFLLALLLAGTSPAGASLSIGAGLFLLGLGWSLCTVAASALLSESAPMEARTDVQGIADLTMGLVAAAAGALGGVVVGFLGYGALTACAAVLVAGIATAAEVARRASADAAQEDEAPPLR